MCWYFKLHTNLLDIRSSKRCRLCSKFHIYIDSSYSLYLYPYLNFVYPYWIRQSVLSYPKYNSYTWFKSLWQWENFSDDSFSFLEVNMRRRATYTHYFEFPCVFWHKYSGSSWVISWRKSHWIKFTISLFLPIVSLHLKSVFFQLNNSISIEENYPDFQIIQLN